MRRFASIAVYVVVAASAQIGLCVSAATAGTPAVSPATYRADLDVGPIVATFKQADFATYYTVAVTPAPGAPGVKIQWVLNPPKDDPGCKKFTQSASNPAAAVWNHGSQDGCLHAHQEGPRGHVGTITVSVRDGVFECRATYIGTVSDTGKQPVCGNTALRSSINHVTSALANESHALFEMKKGRDADDYIEDARNALAHCRKAAVKGGAPTDAVALIDQAIMLDEEVLKQPRAQAIKTLTAAIALKEQAWRLLRAAL